MYIFMTLRIHDIVIEIKCLLHCSAKWVKADGILYKKHCILVKEIDELPIFVFVEELFVKDSSLYFIVEMCETVFFSDHFHAYVFVPTNN